MDKAITEMLFRLIGALKPDVEVELASQIARSLTTIALSVADEERRTAEIDIRIAQLMEGKLPELP